MREYYLFMGTKKVYHASRSDILELMDAHIFLLQLSRAELGVINESYFRDTYEFIAVSDISEVEKLIADSFCRNPKLDR